MAEAERGRHGMGLLGVLFVWWVVAQARNGTERQLVIFAQDDVVVTWEYAQGCFSEDFGWPRKLFRGCWALWLGRLDVIGDRRELVELVQEETDG